jgi:hypothetical protein
MAIVVTITADTAAQLVPMWASLGGHAATVNVDADHMWVDVDLRRTDDQLELALDAAAAPFITEAVPHPRHADVIPLSTAAADTAVTAEARAAHPTALTGCAAAVVAVLSAEPDTSFSPADICAALPAYKANTVKFTVAQLARDAAIERVGRGLYRAVQR